MDEETDVSVEEAPPLNKLAKAYVKVRAVMQKKEKDHDAEMEKLQAVKDELAHAMKDQLLANGTTSARTDAGTVILSKKTRYYASDWEEMKWFIMENDAVDLLEKRIAQKNMAQFLSENPDKCPAGLNSTTEFDVVVRKV